MDKVPDLRIEKVPDWAINEMKRSCNRIQSELEDDHIDDAPVKDYGSFCFSNGFKSGLKFALYEFCDCFDFLTSEYLDANRNDLTDCGGED